MTARSRVQPPGILDRLEDVRERIGAAAQRAGRAPSDVTLVAVSKAFGADRVVEALRAGQRDIGESRPQELRDKAREVGEGPRWHFVGRLQRNKVKYVVGVAELVHSVDGEDLARDISERAARQGRVQPVLAQVNVGADPAKAGFELQGLADVVGRLRELEGIDLQGLMTIPPMDVDSRPLFARLREARDALRSAYPEVCHLSMGMSRDFEAAVEEGATFVRLGEVIFGPRPHPT